MKLGSISPRKINLERVSDAEVLVTLPLSLSLSRFLSHLKERSYLSLLYDYYGELVANFNISANFSEIKLINSTFCSLFSISYSHEFILLQDDGTNNGKFQNEKWYLTTSSYFLLRSL